MRAALSVAPVPEHGSRTWFPNMVPEHGPWMIVKLLSISSPPREFLGGIALARPQCTA
jgi:hypothetical protein